MATSGMTAGHDAGVGLSGGGGPFEENVAPATSRAHSAACARVPVRRSTDPSSESLTPRGRRGTQVQVRPGDGLAHRGMCDLDPVPPPPHAETPRCERRLSPLEKNGASYISVPEVHVGDFEGDVCRPTPVFVVD